MSTEELEKIKNMWGKARGRTIQIVDRDQMDRLTFELHNKIAAMIAHIDSKAAQIEDLKEEADCYDIVQALEDAGIPMGDCEQCQDIITAIEILGSRIEAPKEKLIDERAKMFHQFGDMELDATESDR
jgi:hypothetical protein